MSPSITELIGTAVEAHVKLGGSRPDDMRRLIVALCELAEAEGKLSGVHEVGAAIETQSLIDRASK